MSWTNFTVSMLCTSLLFLLLIVITSTSGAWGKEIHYLDHNLTVGPGEVLTLEDVEIRILGSNGITVDGGSFDIDNVTMTSWDNTTQQPILEPKSRGFIYVINPDSDTSITNSELKYLGNEIPDESRYNGLVYYESKDPVFFHLIANNTLHHMFDGFYSRAAQNMEISRNHVYGNVRYGLDPHSSTDDVLIKNNEVHDNGSVGIICSENCKNITIAENLVHNNSKKKAGIMLALNTNDSIVKDNAVFHENTGISVFGSHNNTVAGNFVEDVSNGIEVKFGSTNNTVYKNHIQFYYDKGISIGANSTGNSIEIPNVTGPRDEPANMIFVKHEVKDLNTYSSSEEPTTTRTSTVEEERQRETQKIMNAFSIGDALGVSDSNSNNSNSTKIEHYTCGDYEDFGFHCDPALYPLTSYAIEANQSQILPSLGADPTYSQGAFGQGILLQGPRLEYIEIDDNKHPYDYNNFTVSFWVKQVYDPVAQKGHIISHTNTESKGGGWFFNGVFDANGSNYVQFMISDHEQNSMESAEIPVSNTTFTHIVGTFNGSTLSVYRNGTLYDVQRFDGDRDNNVSPDSILPIHIGSASYCDSCERWNGIIDEVMLFNGTVSADEAQRLYYQSATATAINNLVGYWGFDGDLGDRSDKQNKNKNNATFFTPIASMTFAPDGRMFLSEKNTGKIMIMQNNTLLPKPFATIDGLYVNWENGLLGLAIDPKFEENHYVYAYYNTISNKTGDPINRVVRFTDKNNTATEMKILLDNIPASRGYHSGGALAFGPDDKLYITVGDATQHIFAQSASVPVGKVLRIERDGSIPADNPYAGSPVYSLGHRNSYGIAFDADSKNGIVFESGDTIYDEINVLKKGGNYGFPTYQPANEPPELSNSTVDIKPIRSYWNTITPTQGIYYNGTAHVPYLNDSFVFGTYTGKLYSIRLDNETKRVEGESHISVRSYPFEPVISLAQSPGGDLFFGSYHVYNLTTLDLGESVQDFFPVLVEIPEYLTVEELQTNPDQNFMYLDVSSTAAPRGNQSSMLKITVPESLLRDVYAVNITEAGTSEERQTSHYSVHNNEINGTNTISVPVSAGTNGRIVIYGEVHLV